MFYILARCSTSERCSVLSCGILEVEDLFFTSLLMYCDCIFVVLRYANCVVLLAEELKGDIEFLLL